jgi:hypothetical protein
MLIFKRFFFWNFPLKHLKYFFFFLSQSFETTIQVVKSRAGLLGIEIVVGDESSLDFVKEGKNFSGVLF